MINATGYVWSVTCSAVIIFVQSGHKIVSLCSLGTIFDKPLRHYVMEQGDNKNNDYTGVSKYKTDFYFNYILSLQTIIY